MSLSRRLLGAVIITAALAFPLGVVASHGFTDVPTSNTFHDDIDAIADAGVTTGCAAAKYCPKDFVTREQMAAFLNRLGALGPGKTPVVNAAKLDGKDSSQFMAAEEIVMVQTGPWQATYGSDPVMVVDAGYTRVASGIDTQRIAMHLDTPASIGGRTYGLESVEICYQASGGPTTTITRTVVERALPGGYDWIIDHGTDYAVDGVECYTVSDATPNVATGGTTLQLTINFPAASAANLGNVTATWTPTTTP